MTPPAQGAAEPGVPRRLEGQVALVTGAAQGIGAAIAARLAQEGAAVVLADLNQDKAAETAAEIQARTGSAAHAERCDVSRAEDLERLFAAVEARLGRLDVLVNNAGVAQARGVLELTPEEWDRLMGVNLRGVFFATQRAARLMLKAPKGGAPGRIVNIASTSGLSPSDTEMPHYDISKAGVVMLTRTCAVHLAPHGIRVNAVAPGTVLTPLITELTDPATVQAWAASVLLGRLGRPEEIGSAVAYLASAEADYITGQVLAVDGGWLLR